MPNLNAVVQTPMMLRDTLKISGGSVFTITHESLGMHKLLLDRLSAEIKKKRPHMQKKKEMFYQDNAPCHESMKTMVKFNELSFELLPRPS